MSVPQLARPTFYLASERIKRFDLGEPGLTDQALTHLITAFPNNLDEFAVVLKAAAINSLYSTNIYALGKVAKHIYSLNIDARLERGDLTLVEDIARVEINGKLRRNYSFASKYCSWHRPDVYPIYDSHVDRLLWDYQQQDRFAEFKRSELWQYPRYKEIIERFRTHYVLNQFSFKELDKFLWQYAVEVYRKSTPPTEAHP